MPPRAGLRQFASPSGARRACRYCQRHAALGYGSAAKGRTVWRQSGGERLRELAHVLHRDFVIRRLKAEVLPQLPALRRQIVNLDRPEKRDYTQADELAWRVRRRGMRVRAARAALSAEC